MGEARLTLKDHSSSWPVWLKEAQQGTTKFDDNSLITPVVITMAAREAEKQFKNLLSDVKVAALVDNYDEQLAELLLSKNAQLYKANIEVKRHSLREHLKQHYGNKQSWQCGSWVYYPWNGRLAHVLEQPLLEELFTIRNQIIITKQEQKKWRDFNVGCAGMSVGSNGAVSIALTGGSHNIKLADGAVLSASNLNRVRSPLANVGLKKSVVFAREIYERNPYQNIQVIKGNLSTTNLEAFFTKPWKLHLLVDEIDDILVKVRLRLLARKYRIPLIMVTEPGNTVMLDVERYDLDAGYPIFHGRAAGIEELIETGFTHQREKLKYIMQIIDPKHLPLRDQQAMLKVGSAIPAPPQLGSTAMFAGGVIAFAARQIATNQPLLSGRHIIDLEKTMLPILHNRSYRRQHREHSKALHQALKSM